MLVQSSRGSLDLLPALPEQWERGAIEGIACRGQVVVDSLAWGPGSARAVIRSAKAQSLMVTFPAEMRAMVVRSSVGQTMGESMASSQLLWLPAGSCSHCRSKSRPVSGTRLLHGSEIRSALTRAPYRTCPVGEPEYI